MRADAFAGQGRRQSCRPDSATFDQTVNAKACDGLAATVKKQTLIRGPVLEQRKQLADGLWPKRAAAGLVSLTPNQDGSRVAVASGRQSEVADEHLGGFTGSGSGVVQK